MLENSEIFMEYSPVIVLLLLYFMQFKIFVTPADLEKKHRQILFEAEKRFAPANSVQDLKEQIGEIKEKIDNRVFYSNINFSLQLFLFCF